MFNTTDVPKIIQNSRRLVEASVCSYAGDRICQSKAGHRVLSGYRRCNRSSPDVPKAFAHILRHIPIIIRDEELVVGSSTIAPRGCQTFPEYFLPVAGG